MMDIDSAKLADVVKFESLHQKLNETDVYHREYLCWRRTTVYITL